MIMEESRDVKQLIGKTFMKIADAIETGSFATKIKIGVTVLGSEHGVNNVVSGAEYAAKKAKDFDIVLIGPKVDTKLEIIEANTEEEMYRKMENAIDEKYIQAAVTMHYDFPIGVSTVGRVVTPGIGKQMFLATTTGTSSMHRTEAMVKNALYGIITAKAMGIENPTVGILNLDGARQVEKALKQLNSNGYKINFAESIRADGGAVMRGNDLLTATSDVMVADTLTGNLLMKMFSSYTTGGSYEGFGYGYGPGIGDGYNRTILIVSRASGAPVIANALEYAAELVRGGLSKVANTEFGKVKEAQFNQVLSSLTKEVKHESAEEDIKAPPQEVATAVITGIDVMDIEAAEKTLWKAGIYAESGMGCTGPIIKVNELKLDQSREVLVKSGVLTD
ncbi:glycine/sarcosine/betaine reductase complex component C subunit alpha [Clostridium tanneri]